MQQNDNQLVLANTQPLIKAEDYKEWQQALQGFIHKLDEKPGKVENFRGQFDYVPIDYVQNQLDSLFFGLWSWKLDGPPQIMTNEVMCYGTLKVWHPVGRIWIERGGVGVAQIRMRDKDFTNIEKKIQNALQMDVPHAEAQALKNAAGKLGDKFGRGLRRDITVEYEPQLEEVMTKEAQEEMIAFEQKIDSFDNANELMAKAATIIKEIDESRLIMEKKLFLKSKLQQKFNSLKGKK